MELKNGTLLALPSAENGIEMFNKGGRILKMQNAATGKVPSDSTAVVTPVDSTAVVTPGEIAEEGDYLTYTV
jgi:hypothetical protein